MLPSPCPCREGRDSRVEVLLSLHFAVCHEVARQSQAARTLAALMAQNNFRLTTSGVDATLIMPLRMADTTDPYVIIGTVI